MPKEKFIDEQTKEFVKEVFEWIQTTGIENGFFSKNWKEDLINYIQKEMQKEGKIVKKESIRRNLNRMIAYYYETGSQARSGRKYLKYIENLFNEYKEVLVNTNYNIAQYFLTTEEARIYRGNIPVLIDLPDFDTKTITIWRSPSS